MRWFWHLCWIPLTATLPGAGLAGCDPGDFGPGEPAVFCPEAAEPIEACEDNGGCAGGEQGRMVGMVEAHNRVRAAQTDPPPAQPLPPMRWSDDLAAVAEAWAQELMARDCRLDHSDDCRYGENLAFFSGFEPTAAEVVEEGWAIEEACYEFGRFLTTDRCSAECEDFGGCGHFTQLIWRQSTEVGCGVASCSGGSGEVWVCNYAPPGNIVGQSPY